MLNFRKATVEDVQIYFEWTNDPEVRSQSFNSEPIDFESHKNWFFSKLLDEKYLLLLFTNENNMKVGQIRVQEMNSNNAIIGISIASGFRGRGLAKDMLKLASDFFLAIKPEFTINAYIKENNLNSKHAFANAGFELIDMTNYENFNSFHYIKKLR